MKLTFDVPEEMAAKIAKDIKVALEEHKKKQTWPQEGDEYYYFRSDGDIDCDRYDDAPVDKDRFRLSNMFKTQEEAEFKREQLKVLHELEQLADDDQLWDDANKHFVIAYDNSLSCLYVEYWRKAQTLPRTYYFKSIQSAEAAINKIGADRLKKYYFCISE